MPDAPIGIRAGASPAGAPPPGSNTINVPLFTWDGAHTDDFEIDEEEFINRQPYVVRHGQRYWGWHPRHGEYREVEPRSVVTRPAQPQISSPPVPQIAVPPVNATLAQR